jgi:membrane protein
MVIRAVNHIRKFFSFIFHPFAQPAIRKFFSTPHPKSHVGKWIYSLRIAWKVFNDKGVLAHASVCGYTTILSLVPILAVSLSILSAFTSIQDDTLKPSTQIEEEILQEKAKETNLSNQVFDFLFEQFIPGAANGAREEIREAKQEILEFIQKTAALRFIGLIFLALTSVCLYNSIEHAFNEIWAVRHRRSLFTKFVSFWILLTLTPLLLGMSYYYTTQLAESETVTRLLQQKWGSWMLQHAVSYSFTLIAFMFANRYLPNVHVNLVPALVGSALSAILWEAAKVAFDFYISYTTSRQGYYTVFGTVAAIPIFILWLYYSYLCFLLGPVIATTIQDYHRHLGRLRRNLIGSSHRPIHSLRVFFEICRHFREKKRGMSLMDLEDDMGWSIARIQRCLRDLDNTGLIHQDHRKEYFYPNADPDHLQISEVMRQLIGLNNGSDEESIEQNEPWEESLNKILSGKGDKSIGALLNIETVAEEYAIPSGKA